MPAHDFIRRIDTSTDGRRFYEGILVNMETQKEERLWCYPSVTTKLDAVYPKDAYLINWIREQGVGGQAIFEQAGEEGTEAHIAIDQLISCHGVPSEGMSNKVKLCVQAFIDWATEFKPVFLKSEEMLVNHEYAFAGSRDALVELNYKDYVGVYCIDYKTSKSVQEKHKVQNAAYWACGEKTDKTAILHLGNTTKARYSFLEYDAEEYWNKFKHYNTTFELEYGKPEPKIVEYPELFKLNLKS